LHLDFIGQEKISQIDSLPGQQEENVDRVLTQHLSITNAVPKNNNALRKHQKGHR
jgi:hypothetical protein